jgi:flagellar hook assembly protein FlgD
VRCYPNPFNPRATIAFELGGPVTVVLGIYDLGGRLVRSLFAGPLSGGAHQLVWDGRDGDGAGLASGVYLCRLQAGAETATRKLALLR